MKKVLDNYNIFYFIFFILHMKKITLLFLLGLFSLFIVWCNNRDQVEPDSIVIEKPIGGERDDYGCLWPAGYTWDNDLWACTRDWELDDNQKKAATIAMVGLDGLITIERVDVVRCPGCFSVVFRLNTGDKLPITVQLENWEIVEDSETLSSEQCLEMGWRTVNTVWGFTCEEGEENLWEVVGFISPNICCK